MPRSAFGAEGLSEKVFDGCLLAIDEFHHVSADADNRLGELIRSIMAISSAHIIAMTGSYFRGTACRCCCPDDERKFTKVTYNYYEQLNGYSSPEVTGHRLSFLPGEVHRRHHGGAGYGQARPSCTFPV